MNNDNPNNHEELKPRSKINHYSYVINITDINITNINIIMKNKLTLLEKTILRHLKRGKTTEEISTILKDKEIKPNSISTVEKTLRELRDTHKANNMFQLAYKLKLKKII